MTDKDFSQYAVEQKDALVRDWIAKQEEGEKALEYYDKITEACGCVNIALLDKCLEAIIHDETIIDVRSWWDMQLWHEVPVGKPVTAPNLKMLTCYIPLLDYDVIDEEIRKNNMNSKHYTMFSETIYKFWCDTELVCDCSGIINWRKYHSILADKGISMKKLTKIDVSTLNLPCTLAALIAFLRAERFCEGAILASIRSGTINNILRHLESFQETLEQ